MGKKSFHLQKQYEQIVLECKSHHLSLFVHSFISTFFDKWTDLHIHYLKNLEKEMENVELINTELEEIMFLKRKRMLSSFLQGITQKNLSLSEKKNILAFFDEHDEHFHRLLSGFKNELSTTLIHIQKHKKVTSAYNYSRFSSNSL